MMSSNPDSIKLPFGNVEPVKGVHKYGRFAVREIAVVEPSFCCRAGRNVVGACSSTHSQDKYLKGTNGRKSPEDCFVEVEEMCAQNEGAKKIVVNRPTRKGSMLSPLPKGGVLGHVCSASSLSMGKSEMESIKSNSFSKPVELGLQNLDFVATFESLKQLQESNKQPDLNTHQQETVVSADLVSRLLLQNQAVLDRLSSMGLSYSTAVTEYSPFNQQCRESKGAGAAAAAPAPAPAAAPPFDSRLGGHQQYHQHQKRAAVFHSEPSLGVPSSYSLVRLKNVLDQMRGEIDLATYQCRERDIELNIIKEKNRSLNEKLQMEQSKVSMLVSRLERSQQRNRVLQEEAHYLSSFSSVENSDSASGNAPSLQVEDSVGSTASYNDLISLQQKHSALDVIGTPIRNCGMEAARKSNNSPIKEVGDSPVKSETMNHMHHVEFTPEKNLQGGGLQAPTMQQQSTTPPQLQWDSINRSHTVVPLLNQHGPAFEVPSNGNYKYSTSGMPTSGPRKNSSSCTKDVHAFIMSSFQQQEPFVAQVSGNVG